MRKLLIGLLFACGAFAQDCIIRFNFSVTSGTITPAAQAYNNKQSACVNWQMNVFVSGVSAQSIQFESASDAGTTPILPFAVFAGTLLSGTNPSTTTTQSQSTFTGMYPWVRINPTSATGSGTITGVLYGFKATSSSINSIFSNGNMPLLGIALSSLTPPSNLTWSWYNQSTATVSNVGNYFQFVKTGDAATQFSGYYTTFVAGSGTCVIAIVPHSVFASFLQSGIFITDGTKAETLRLREDGATQDVVTWTNSSTVSATVASTSLFGRSPNVARVVFLKVKEAAGTRSWQFSGDGVHWNSLLTEATGTFLTPTGCGVMLLNNTAIGCNPDTTNNCFVQTTMLAHAVVTSP